MSWLPILSSMVWGGAIKAILIVAVSLMLSAVAALLVMEIVGKKTVAKGVPASAQPAQPDKEQIAAPEQSEQPQENEAEIELEESATLVDDEETDTGTMIVGEVKRKVRYNRSFTAKLSQADDVLKLYYNELCNELAYYGLKQRMSWSNDSWYSGRVTYAKFAIRGKTLSLYLALETKEFEGTKYIFEDSHSVGKYSSVPMRLKIKSDRALRWAKELIGAMAVQRNWTREETSPQDYREPYRDTATLVREKLIKLYNAELPESASQAELREEVERADISASAQSVELAEGAKLMDGDDGESGIMMVGDTYLKVRYNRSFTARLIQADDALKGFYSDLRNEFMRYGMKPRASWSNESWYNGRATYAKFAIRGKTLSLYLALEPSEFGETKYSFSDASGVTKYHDVPMRLKIKSTRGVRWAKELIATIAEENEFTRKSTAEQNFRPDWRDTKSLVHDKLIKLYCVANSPISKAEMEAAATADLKEQDRTPREFINKFMRADKDMKARYSAIKNELLRYGMKPRMSHSNESWYRGRVTYAKFAIRGKTLSLYMALDPKEFEETKYNFANMGDVGKYEMVPMRVKLKSDRSVRWVKELIAVMAEKKGWKRSDLREEDFRYVDKTKKK